MGGKIVEKHFMIKKKEITADSFFSMDFIDFKKMTQKIREVEKALGSVNYNLTKSSIKNYNGRRSLYVSSDIGKGEKISEKNIKSVRPGFGLHPKYFQSVIGKKVIRDLKFGDRLRLEDISGLKI